MAEWHGVSEEDKALSRRDKNAIEFAFNYSKLWCKSCKDIVLGLEKRAYAENEACRAIVKQFQTLEASVTTVNGAPMKQQTLMLARMMVDHCKEMETHNTKRCRELLEVLTRQRTLFEKTRKYLKDKWKAEVKRMLDAENVLIKTKSGYYQRCQTGVKLREELAAAQNLLNELSASMSNIPSAAGTLQPGTSSTLSGGSNMSSPLQSTTVSSSNSGVNQTAGSAVSLVQEGSDVSADVNPTLAGTATSTQVAKQKAKVERLEKQLSDNDKKEIEQMYAYRESVETANSRLYDLEKTKMEILCDIRLTIMKSDEVVKDSLAELFNHLHTTRMAMINQYQTVASAFQDYVPCSDYKSLLEDHIQKGVDYFPEKYQFAGFHEAAASGLKLDALPGRFLGRTAATCSKEASESDPLCIHSDSESDGEPQVENNTNLSSKSTGSTVLSSLVEFGSSLFRPDSKKSIRKRGQGATTTAVASTGIPVSATSDALDNLSTQLANLEREYISACYPVARCVSAIEKQPGGLETHGIYRVPASKAKVASLLETLQSSQPSSPEQIADDIAVLSQEHPLTLAGLIKTRLIALPEPLLTYSLYPNFVELGKVYDSADPGVVKELVKRLRLLINHLSPGNLKLAGLLFHHLHRVAACQSENQMSPANLGTMFGPTVLRQKPKFQVANMMEFMDNKGQTRVVEVLIECVTEIFGPADQYDPIRTLISLANSNDTPLERNARRSSASAERQRKDDGDQNRTNRLSVTHLPVVRTHSTTPTLAGDGKDSPIATQSQHGLLRSATISAASPGRSSAFLGSPLPLYTPYRGPHSGEIATDQKSNVTAHLSAIETAPVRLVKLAERADTLVSKENASNPLQTLTTTSNSHVLIVKAPATTTTTVPTMSAFASPTTACSSSSHGTSSDSVSVVNPPSSSSLVVKNLRKFVSGGASSQPASSGTASSISPKGFLGSTGRQFTVSSKHMSDKSSTVTTIPTGQNTLSNLVIGRRRPITRLNTVTTHQTHSTEDSGDGRSPVDLEDYSYIDTDPSDSASS
ncbi:hypothetical protein P879_02333 [Paragonimus westermani]|uniref:Rho-GAP domain-containing protein n=1 Tax=Paragonimus westermani TaxID=34504 RepID=A0A8T0D2T3_9TREM|nr:hypothetical protein P879_02333 [Paragonimus westermani]